MKKQVLHFQSRHESGNIFWILGKVRMIMQKERKITAYNDMWQEVQNCGTYEEALKIISHHVILADRDTLNVYKDGACKKYNSETGLPKETDNELDETR